MLTRRWNPLRHHETQAAYLDDRYRFRFRVVCAGRRSGKSELVKRETVEEAILEPYGTTWRAVLGAPTHQQAKAIYWADLIALSPKDLVTNVNRSDLIVTYWNGARIQVAGLDVPARIEGEPLDKLNVDEVDDCKPSVWHEHARPALDTEGRPPGRASFTGVPNGRKLLYDLFCRGTDPKDEEWKSYHWKSADILSADAIESAKRDLDPLTFQQEYEADFVTFSGRAYYAFRRETHLETLAYDPALPLLLCFDFGVDPGVALIAQDIPYKGARKDVAPEITACLGEVFIPREGYVSSVCQAILADPRWRNHPGAVRVYGDPSGGSRHASQAAGQTAWNRVREHLIGAYGGRMRFEIDKRDPGHVARIDTVNARLLSAKGQIRMLVDPNGCPKLVRDLEGVVLKEGADREILKERGSQLTHISDALAYMVCRRHALPAVHAHTRIEPMY